MFIAIIDWTMIIKSNTCISTDNLICKTFSLLYFFFPLNILYTMEDSNLLYHRDSDSERGTSYFSNIDLLDSANNHLSYKLLEALMLNCL